MRRTVLASAGGVTAAILGSLCCVGPLLFVTVGVGAGLASTFEPLRPVFGALMVAMLAVGFYTVHGRRPSTRQTPDHDCASDEACAAPRRRARDKLLLWTATVVALVLWTFPTWSRLFV
ncbi:MAG: mercuric transporter MerT family protein [Gemmatimonadaceae bacterium]